LGHGLDVIWLIKFAMCAMMPRTEKLPGIADTELDVFVRRMRKEADPIYWLGLVVGAWVFALSPILTVYLPLPAFFLTKKLLARHVERVFSLPSYTLRQGVFLVRLSAGMCWGADPAVRARFALLPYGADPGTFRES
jgi:hypothetical protein